MAKWADYLISAVKYNDAKTAIVAVKVHQDLGDKISIATEHSSRQKVIQDIENGKRYMTITKSESGYQNGQKVEIVLIDGQKFIKTLKDNIQRDNLEELPEF